MKNKQTRNPYVYYNLTKPTKTERKKLSHRSQHSRSNALLFGAHSDLGRDASPARVRHLDERSDAATGDGLAE